VYGPIYNPAPLFAASLLLIVECDTMDPVELEGPSHIEPQPPARSCGKHKRGTIHDVRGCWNSLPYTIQSDRGVQVRMHAYVPQCYHGTSDTRR
jgi:hypothetical protein